MAYLQSTASGIDDVMSQICAFAVANAGFTDNGVVNYGGLNRYRISKGGIYWTFYSWYGMGHGAPVNMHHIVCKMSYSISALADPTSANGQYLGTYMSLWGFPGPYPTLYLYTDGNAIHACLELTTGVFNHISLGSIIKYDTFVGGEFVAANLWDYQDSQGNVPNPYLFTTVDNAYVNLQFNGGFNTKTNPTGRSYIRNIKASGQTSDEADFAGFSDTRNSNQAFGCSYDGVIQPLIFRSPNTATLRSVLLPQYIFLRDYVTGLNVLSGYVPAMRLVNMKYLDPGEIILNDWQVFPYIAKAGDRVNYPVSGDYGVAYKRA